MVLLLIVDCSQRGVVQRSLFEMPRFPGLCFVIVLEHKRPEPVTPLISQFHFQIILPLLCFSVFRHGYEKLLTRCEVAHIPPRFTLGIVSQLSKKHKN